MRLVLSFVGLAVVFLVSWMIWGGAWDEKLTFAGAVAWLEGTGSWAWAAGVGLLVADLVLPMPGTIVMAALGYIYGAMAGGGIAFAGAMAASFSGYGAGRLLGERAARKWLGDRDFERGKEFFGDGGGWMVALSRALPILPEVVACMAGLSRMPVGRFALASACGNLPMAFVFAAIGASGKDAPWWAVAASLAVPGVLWLIAGKWRK